MNISYLGAAAERSVYRMLDSGNSCFIRLPFQAWDYLAEMC